MLLYGKKGETMDFSETIVGYDLKLATDDRSEKPIFFSMLQKISKQFNIKG